MKKLKVFTVVGTRPEIIRLSRILPHLDACCDHQLIHTGQNYDYELNQIFFDDLGIRSPDFVLNVAGETSSQTIGNVIIEVDKLLVKEKPEAILVLGDTNSCMAVLPAKRRKIPTFHMEAGNRCFDMRVPEEINRKIVDHLADINLPYSSIAREYLLREGLPPDQIIKTGSPMFEVLTYYNEKICNSTALEKLNLKKGHYFLISLHREENIESHNNFQKIIEILNNIAQIFTVPVIVSTHPRTKKRINEVNHIFNSLISFNAPLSFTDYNCLQKNAKAVLSDSGTLTEESSILGFPALNLREAHERPEGMEQASVMMVGLELGRILQALDVLFSENNTTVSQNFYVRDYQEKNVSEKIVRIIHSYTDYVNRVVWKKF